MQFIANAPAAVIGEWLVVSDVHLGFEFELQSKGVRLWPDAKASAAEFNRLLAESGCTKVAVLGDFKHDVRGFASREKRLVSDFCAMVDAKDIIVVKGNHDSSLVGYNKLQVKPATGIVLTIDGKSYGLHHGHAWPDPKLFKCDYLLMGNNHPAIEFSDSLGFNWVKKAWVHGAIKIGKANRALVAPRGVVAGQIAIVFPAFSQLYPGTPFNRLDSFELLGPLFKSRLFDLDNAKAIGLDGVRLGRIKDLRGA